MELFASYYYQQVILIALLFLALFMVAPIISARISDGTMSWFLSSRSSRLSIVLAHALFAIFLPSLISTLVSATGFFIGSYLTDFNIEVFRTIHLLSLALWVLLSGCCFLFSCISRTAIGSILLSIIGLAVILCLFVLSFAPFNMYQPLAIVQNTYDWTSGALFFSACGLSMYCGGIGVFCIRDLNL